MTFLSLLLFIGSPAFAWENHALLMERLLDSEAAKSKTYLQQKISFPCGETEKTEIAVLANTLQIDGSKVPLFSAERCKKDQQGGEIALSELLVSNVIDEPDYGMDQNLPDASDPHHDRKWMGGSTGPTSQGFRHMIFPGVQMTSPLETFQVPLSSVGQALERVAKMREVAKTYFDQGKVFWGVRITLWELHYLQDLQQPFHVTQVPALKLVPWNKLFSHFVAETTHAIGNYHYAYEGLVFEMVNESEMNDFQTCFEPETGAAFSQATELMTLPKKKSAVIGKTVYAIFGDHLKEAEVDLPNHLGEIDYFALLHAVVPEVPTSDEKKELRDEDLKLIQEQRARANAIQELKTNTCELMKSLSRYTWAELDQAMSQSISKSNAK